MRMKNLISINNFELMRFVDMTFFLLLTVRDKSDNMNK